MSIENNIENLLYFANSRLLLDELDVRYSRNRIMELLGITQYNQCEPDTEAVDAMEDPSTLLTAIEVYAYENKIIKGDKMQELGARIMDIVSLRTSEIYDLFSDLYASSVQKAFDWLYDYQKSMGYCKPYFEKSERWDCKIGGIKAELAIADAKTAIKSDEGSERNASLRMIPLDGLDALFTFSARPLIYQQGEVTFDGEVNLVDALADIVDENANFCALTDGTKVLTGAKTVPLFKAVSEARLKSASYPFMEISASKYFARVLHFSHTHKAKTVEFANKIVDAWKARGDSVTVCRKIDHSYCFDIVLLAPAQKQKNERALLKSAFLPTDCLGVIALDGRVAKDVAELESRVFGENKEPLPDDMKPYQKLLDKLLKEPVTSRLEARLNIHDELNLILDKIMNERCAIAQEEYDAFLKEVLA